MKKTQNIQKMKLTKTLQSMIMLGLVILVVAIMVIPSVSAWMDSMNVGLKGYWKLDESSGNALESVFAINNGTLGASESYAIGKINNSLKSSSTTNAGIMNITNTGTPFDVGTGDFAVNFWINITGSATDYVFMGYGTYQDGADWFIQRVGTTFSVDWYNNGGHRLTFGNATKLNEWHRILFMRNSSGTYGQYDNDTIVKATATDSVNHAGKNLQFQGMTNWNGMIGSIDEVSFHNRSLTSEEIDNSWYNSSATSYSPTIYYANYNITTTLVTPTTNQNFANNNVYFNCNVTSGVAGIVSNATLYIQNGTTTDVYINTTGWINNITLNASWTKTLADGYYNWTCLGIGINSTFVSWATNRTFMIDTTSPNINVVYPTNTTYTTKPIQLNYSVSDLNLQSCWWTNNSGLTNNTITCGTNVTEMIANEGSNNWIVYANDNIGNVNSSSTIFFVDTISPLINFVTPTETNNFWIQKRSILVNVTSSDISLANITSYLYNSTGTLLNSTISTSSPLYVNYSVSSDGDYYINATAWDTFGHSNSTETRKVRIDTFIPIINIYSPEDLEHFTTYPTFLNFSVLNTGNIDACWYNTDDNLTNRTIPSCTQGENTYNALVGFHEGWNNLTLYANDSIALTSIPHIHSIFIDTILPTTEQGYTNGGGGGYIKGINNSITNQSMTNFTANVSDIYGLQNVTITILNNTNGIVSQATGFFTNIFSTLFGVPITLVDGVYNWFIEAYDTSSNYVISNVMAIIVDTTPSTFTSQDYNVAWQNDNNFVYKVNVTITEPNLNILGITFEGTNYSIYNIGGNVWEYNFTKNLTYVPYTSTYYWWAIDNATNYGQSNDYNFNVQCPIGYKTFNNSLCVEDITFVGNENKTRYLSIPSSISILTSGRLNLSGILLNSAGNCYQESANVSTICGGVGTGNYLVVPNYFYINYTKPTNALSSSLWQVKHGNSSQSLPYNVSVPIDCWNANANKLSFRFVSQSYEVGYPWISYGQCLNSTGWKTITNIYNNSKVGDVGYNIYGGANLVDENWDSYAGYGGGGWYPTIDGNGIVSSSVYEEAMNWDLSPLAIYPLNPSLSIENSNVWNYSGNFSSTSQTSNFAITFTKYLNSTYLFGSNYLIPFVFHSDTTGILRYFDLEYENTGFYENYQTYNPTTSEGANEKFDINISFDGTQSTITNASLIYNGISYQGTQIGNGNNVQFTRTITIPSINLTQNFSFYWIIEMTNSSGAFIFGSSTKQQNVVNIDFDDCSVYTNVVYNMTLFNEADKSFINPNSTNTTIEATLTLSSLGTTNQVLNKSKTWFKINPSQICINTNLSNFSYRTDMIISYKADGYVQEFYYIDNGVLSSITNPNINLYDLLSSESTSFLINYQDENYLYIQGVVVDVWRKYIGIGEFISVEHGKTDEGGQTKVHLVTEDVIYKFLIWKDGVLQYTSPEYLALCQATPCQINLKKPYGEAGGLSIYKNLAYSLEVNESQRKVTLTYATTDGSTTAMEMNVTMTALDKSENNTICSDFVVSSGGTLVCEIPTTFANVSYTTQITRDGKFFGFKEFSLSMKAKDIFGATGLILTALAFLTLALMGISSGIVTIVLGIIGLVFVSLLSIFESGNIFGIGSAIIWLIVAGIIIIYKISQRRIS